MHHAAPPPLCRASALRRSVAAQGAAQGLMITLGLDSGRPCRLPARPVVRILVAGRAVRLRQVRLPLGAENVPRRTIAPRRAATAILRWQNWCGPRGPVAVRLTLGGSSVVEQLGPATRGPTCVSRRRRPTLAVSLFVRR